MSGIAKRLYRFADFVVDADQRVLLRNGTPMPLTPKVFDTLLVLVENSGRIVGKEELMNRLWPDSFVEESNLPFNIQQLRKCLGDDARHPRFVETVSRRGYRLIVPVEEVNSNGDREPKTEFEPSHTSPKQAAIVEGGLKRQRRRIVLGITLGVVVVG